MLLVVVLSAAPLLIAPATASAQVSVGISVRIGPPPLPVYPQPFVPGPGYIWTPGYWAWGAYGYYWVPGSWVLAPAVGLLWTPGYWAWNEGFYRWHPGYWGSRVGFYGGIHYGYGYVGVGYAGGYWRGGAFYYNRAVSNVNVTYIHNTYNRTVVRNTMVTRVSYNGGTGGTRVRLTAEQRSYARERHLAPTAAQVHQERLAMDNPAQRFSSNRGRPRIAATDRLGAFKGPGVVRINSNGRYAYRPAPRDRVAYRGERSTETREAAPQREPEHPHPARSNEERRGARPRLQARGHSPDRKERHRCRPNDPRCR